MQRVKLYQFPTQVPQREIARAWQWLESQKKFAILYGSTDGLVLTWFDWQASAIHTLGPWPYTDEGFESLSALCVVYPSHWIIGSLSNNVLVSSIVFDEATQEISVHVLLNDPCHDNARIGPFYAFWRVRKKCVVIYQKPEADYMRNSAICMSQFDLSSKSRESITLEEADSAMVCEGESHVLLLTLNPHQREGLG